MNKDNTARVVVCTEIGIGRAYTFEASYCGTHISYHVPRYMQPIYVFTVYERTIRTCIAVQ